MMSLPVWSHVPSLGYGPGGYGPRGYGPRGYGPRGSGPRKVGRYPPEPQKRAVRILLECFLVTVC